MVNMAPTTRPTLSEDEARKQWLKERQHSIGSSDAAAVLGLHPFKSAYALWAEKSGLVQPDPYPREAAQWGQIIEPIIAAQYEKRTGRALVDYGRFCLQRNPQYPFAHATMDREIVAFNTRGRGVLEIKNVSLRLASHWGED